MNAGETTPSLFARADVWLRMSRHAQTKTGLRMLASPPRDEQARARWRSKRAGWDNADPGPPQRHSLTKSTTRAARSRSIPDLLAVMAISVSRS